jgi:hypothetical protein
LLLDQAMQPRPPKQPIHRLLDDALLCTHQHNKSITKQHDRNIVLDIPFDIDRGKREGTTTNLEKNNLRAARTCRGRRPEETKSSGGGTWYRQGFKSREKKNFGPQRETRDPGNFGIFFYYFLLFYFFKFIFSQKILKY